MGLRVGTWVKYWFSFQANNEAVAEEDTDDEEMPEVSNNSTDGESTGANNSPADNVSSEGGQTGDERGLSNNSRTEEEENSQEKQGNIQPNLRLYIYNIFFLLLL